MGIRRVGDPYLVGRLLVAAPTLRDGNFDRTIVFVLDHDAEGAVGVVLNRPTDLTVAETLPAWHDRAVEPRVVFAGGPVADGVAIGIGRARSGVAEVAGWSPVMGRVGVVDLAVDPDATGDLEDIRVFSGYAGWSAGQLEGELALGAWFVVDATDADVLGPAPERLWARVLGRQEGDLAMLALYPPDPSMN